MNRGGSESRVVLLTNKFTVSLFAVKKPMSVRRDPDQAARRVAEGGLPWPSLVHADVDQRMCGGSTLRR